MATGRDTKTTQPEEEKKEGYSLLTAKDVEFTCPDGINVKLKTFHEVREKALFLQLELDGKIYSGCLLEAVDSFAPVNLVSSERCCTTVCETSKTQHSDVKKQKKTNVYSRENYPKGHVDVHNTIEERLRFGRDRRNFDSRTLCAEGYSSPNFKKDIASTKSYHKIKSLCSDGVENSTSNEDSPLINYQKKNRCSGRGRKKTDGSVLETTETSNENSSFSYSVFEISSASGLYKDVQSKLKHNEERSTISSDTSLYSPDSKMQCGSRKCEFQISVAPISTENKAMSQFSPDQLGTEPDLITFSPEINSETLCKNDDVSVNCVSSTRVSSSQLSEPNLITFSPRTKTKILCMSNDEVFQSSSLDQSSQNQSLKLKLSASLRNNKRAKDLLDSNDVEFAASDKITFHQCRQNKVESSAKKVDSNQIINENNKLPVQEANHQFPESQVENTSRGKEMLSVSGYITVKNAPRADSQSSLASKFQYSGRNIEIQSLDGLNNPETTTLGDAMFHQFKEYSSSGKHNETNVMLSFSDESKTSRKCKSQQFESKLISQREGDTRDISTESNDERSSYLCCEPISRNISGKETEKSDNGDKALENTECKVALSPNFPSSADYVKQLESSDVVIAAPQFGHSCQSSKHDLQPSMKENENLAHQG